MKLGGLYTFQLCTNPSFVRGMSSFLAKVIQIISFFFFFFFFLIDQIWLVILYDHWEWSYVKLYPHNLLLMAFNMPPIPWFAYKGPAFSLVFRGNAGHREAVEEEEEARFLQNMNLK